MLIKFKKTILINLKKVSTMQDSININNIKFMCFINSIQLLMLNVFIILHVNTINVLTFLFLTLSASAMLNIIMQSLKSKFKALSAFSVQSFFTIN